jgi:hypothetical protein
MEIIFGKDMDTGNFAKDSSPPLGKEDVPSSGCEEGATSNARTTKRAKIVESVEDGLISAFNKVGDKLAMAITQVAKSNNGLPEDLFFEVNSLSVSGFSDIHISMYHAHLVANPLTGKAFYGLPFDHQLNWMAMLVSERFPSGE